MSFQHRGADLPPTSTADGRALVGLMVPLGLSTLFVLGRSYSRLFVVSSWGLDDTSIIAAWISTLICIILMSFSTSYGPEISKSCSIFNYSAIIAYFVAIFLTKISILFFYLRILPPSNSGRGGRTCVQERLWEPRLLTQATILLVTCFSVPLIISSTLSCTPETPQKYLFNANIACVPFLPLLYANAVLSAITDLWLLAIIVPCVLGLQLMRPRQKASLVILFCGAGLVVILAGILRVTEIARSITTTPIPAWNVDFSEIWTAVELCLGLICASLPGLVPLLRKMAPGVMGALMGDSAKSCGDAAAAAAANAAAMAGAWTGHSASCKSRIGGGDKDGTVLELHGGSRNQSVIRSFAKGGKPPTAGRFGARAASTKKVGWYGGGWAEREKKKNSSWREADNESQEDVLSSREESDGGLRPDTGIVKTSEVVITESRVHGSDDDWP